MWHKTQQPSTTRVTSVCKNDGSTTYKTESTLKLQRRETHFKERPSVETNVGKHEPECCRTLQRRKKTGLVEKDDINKSSETCVKVKTPLEKRDEKSGLSQSSTVSKSPNYLPELRTKAYSSANSQQFHLKPLVNGINARNLPTAGSLEDLKSCPNNNLKERETYGSSSSRRQDTVKTRIAKSRTLENPKTPKSGASGLLRSASARDQRSPAETPKRPGNSMQAVQRKICDVDGQINRIEETSRPPKPLYMKDDLLDLQPKVEDDPHKEENCAVTVAVRVRPFSNRERTAQDTQVVFMKGRETFVQHPDTKQNHTFIFDFSFWSFDKSDATYASQETVYENLVVPLLERSLLGYNTCLFAYGQTGSGKSYTMMGFDEETGIIARFCQHLFSRIQTTKQQISFHLEMSYFEVYNEKIHDLLVFKADNGQKNQPLRVREHPLLGPYVEELSTNVVSSFQDIQSWLELGNKQRATAATGMNDKSSRSHSVFTVIMTQTKTELVDGEEHDHRITSRINFLDLAGSERCTSAKTSGERLKEGISINKSLLTLGKVISALSESSQMKKKAFVSYRESVLTWLLKDSLGGNSKTAMIATISPALSNIEETLSTLRYAKQACLVVNIAKVNEDMNAKLIRELKFEIEKLKAARLTAKNLGSERFTRCQQEISSLKLKLSQQEKEMSELHRIWKERLEQAEQRKREETRELQKAGIAFKMDNRLPNLVNLNEDPQLSEMLLYMIKEGKTTVGKYQVGSSHDIQLSGALIAEDHCVITNADNIIRIIPTRDAKTYVNGLQISTSSILHHGDRVILGGDHYFRFNHPDEVQRLRGQFRASVLTPEGPKDFEFAKNELLTAQRPKLEEEIEGARLRAKEEMLQGIQIAKEMAQQELSCQRSIYEEKIKALETELKTETQKKQQQEMTSQKAASKIQELEEVKVQLQHEIHFNKRRLQMETFATKQALEDHTIHHAKILQALEAEKQKIAKEVQMLQQEKRNREKSMSVEPSWNSLKLSVMIQEANTISAKLEKHTVFSRHEVPDKENNIPGNSVQIQVRNLRLGIITYWSLDKFENKLAAMKELYENNNGAKEDDLFYDPTDEWELDLSKSSLSILSRRRSKSLLRNKRISGCLYQISVHPVQRLQFGHSSDLMNKSSSFLSNSSNVCSNGHNSHIPEICKDLIGGALEYLGQCHANESSVADSLISCVRIVCKGVHSVSQAYEQQNEDSTEPLFEVSREAQAYVVQLTSAFQQLVVLTKHWLDNFPESQKASQPTDDLLLYIKKLGGYLQLFLQGCCSDISAMVTETKSKASHAVEKILHSIGHLAALTDCGLHLSQEESIDTPLLQKSFMDILKLGVCYGLKSLIEGILDTSSVMQSEIQRCSVNEKVHEEIKNTSSKLVVFLKKCLVESKKINLDILLRDSGFGVKCSLSAGLHTLKMCLDLLQHTILSILKGADTDTSQVLTSLNDIHCSASTLNKSFLTLSHHVINLAELQSLLEALFCAIQQRESKRLHPSVQSMDTLRRDVCSPTAIQLV